MLHEKRERGSCVYDVHQEHDDAETRTGNPQKMTIKNLSQSGVIAGKEAKRPSRLLSLAGAIFPILVISGLFYAAFFVKPVVRIAFTPPPIIEARDIFYSMAMPGNDVIWAAGNHGKIIRSENAGASWKKQESTVSVHLQGLAAWDDARAVAIGNNATLLITADGGENWERVAPPADAGNLKLLKVRAGAHPGNAIIAGEFGLVLATKDFGRSWKLASTGADVSWNDAAMISNDQWLLVGEFGQILYTNDAGDNWQRLESPVESSLNAVWFRDAQNGVAVGTEGVILVTSDGGQTWRTATPVNSTHIYDVTWDGKRWLAVGDKGLLLAGRADGLRWSDQSLATSAGWRSHIAFDGENYALSGRGIEVTSISSSSEVMNIGAKQ